MNYSEAQEKHILSNRRKDHGYHSKDSAKFKHFDTKGQKEGKYDDKMFTFRNALHKTGHPAKPDVHIAGGMGNDQDNP